MKGEVSDYIYMLLCFCSVSMYQNMEVSKDLCQKNKIARSVSSRVLTPTPPGLVLPSTLRSACFAWPVGFRTGDWLGLKKSSVLRVVVNLHCEVFSSGFSRYHTCPHRLHQGSLMWLYAWHHNQLLPFPSSPHSSWVQVDLYSLWWSSPDW